MLKKLLAIVSLIGIGIAGRLLPHMPNATPITAISVAAGRYVGKAWAISVPIAAMLLSDLVIGLYDWKILLNVYISFALIGVMNMMTKRYRKIAPTGFMLIASALLFFLVTNFAVWVFSPWYAKSVSGLLYAYELGLPFLRNMLAGDIIYTAILLAVCQLPYTVIALKKLMSRRFGVGVKI